MQAFNANSQLMRFLTTYTTLFVLSGLSGCALEPQQVTVTPAFYVAGDPIGQQEPVFLRVIDARPNAIVGSRGYNPAKSAISVSNDFTSHIQVHAEKALKQLGFVVTEHRSAPLQLTVSVKKLDYRVASAAVIFDVYLNAEVAVTVADNGRFFRAAYRTNANNKFAAAPSAEKNEQLINQVLTRALSNAFNDEALRQFLAKRKSTT